MLNMTCQWWRWTPARRSGNDTDRPEMNFRSTRISPDTCGASSPVNQRVGFCTLTNKTSISERHCEPHLFAAKQSRYLSARLVQRMLRLLRQPTASSQRRLPEFLLLG